MKDDLKKETNHIIERLVSNIVSIRARFKKLTMKILMIILIK